MQCICYGLSIYQCDLLKVYWCCKFVIHTILNTCCSDGLEIVCELAPRSCCCAFSCVLSNVMCCSFAAPIHHIILLFIFLYIQLSLWFEMWLNSIRKTPPQQLLQNNKKERKNKTARNRILCVYITYQWNRIKQRTTLNYWYMLKWNESKPTKRIHLLWDPLGIFIVCYYILINR